jgi:hypothetical protein
MRNDVTRQIEDQVNYDFKDTVPSLMSTKTFNSYLIQRLGESIIDHSAKYNVADKDTSLPFPQEEGTYYSITFQLGDDAATLYCHDSDGVWGCKL